MAAPATPPAQLTHGAIGPILWRLGLPMTLGVFFLIAVNFVDTYFVGLLGVAPLAAMSFTFPIISIVMGLTMGLGVGATSAISRAIGGGDTDHVKQLTTHAMLLSIVVVAVISSIGLLFQEPIFLMLGAKPALIPLIKEYMTIWFVGVVFLVVPIVGNGAIRATGDARSPMLMMMIAAVLNGILDPLLIFGWGPVPGLGLKGAAIGTLIARAAMFVIAVYLLHSKLGLIAWERPRWSEVMASWRSILSVGLPASLTNLLAPLAATAVTAMIAAHGAAAIAAYGLGGRIEGLLLIVPLVMGGVLSPFIGQNWGAHLVHRVVAGVRLATIVAVAWGLGAWLLIEVTAPYLAPLLTKDVGVQASLITYLRILSAGYAVHGIVNVVSASFNAMDHAIRSTILSALQGLLLAVPLAIIGDRISGFAGILVGLVAAKYITAALAARWLKSMFSADDLMLSKMSKDTQATLDKIEARTPELATRIEQLVSDVGHWEAVEVGSARGDTLSFRLKGRELGHLHTDGRMDLPLPPSLHDALIEKGVVEHHDHHHDSCWVTHRMDDQDDIEESRWLLQLGHLVYLGAVHGWDDEATQSTLDAVAPSDGLKTLLRDAIEHIRQHRPAEG